jgi:hypothetical protein
MSGAARAILGLSDCFDTQKPVLALRFGKRANVLRVLGRRREH